MMVVSEVSRAMRMMREASWMAGGNADYLIMIILMVLKSAILFCFSFTIYSTNYLQHASSGDRCAMGESRTTQFTNMVPRDCTPTDSDSVEMAVKMFYFLTGTMGGSRTICAVASRLDLLLWW